MLPCGIQANSMESMWIPHGFQVKCPKKEIFAPECMESLWNPCGIHPHSRFIPCRVQKEVFSDYLHGIHMDSSWIPGNIIQKKKSKKIQKKSKKILWPQVHKNYDIMLCQNEVSSKYFSCQQSMTTDVQCMSLTNMQLQTTSSSFYSLYILCQTRLWCEILQHKISWLVWHCWLVQLWHVISMTICTLTTTNGHSNIWHQSLRSVI